MIGTLLSWHKPTRPRLTEEQKAASAASFLGRYAAAKRQAARDAVADDRTAQLRAFVAAGGHVDMRPREIVVDGARRVRS